MPRGGSHRGVRGVAMSQVGRGVQHATEGRGHGTRGSWRGEDRAMASGACQVSGWALVVQCWLRAGTPVLSVEAVQSQVILQGTAGRETRLGVDLLRERGDKGYRLDAEW